MVIEELILLLLHRNEVIGKLKNGEEVTLPDGRLVSGASFWSKHFKNSILLCFCFINFPSQNDMHMARYTPNAVVLPHRHCVGATLITP